MSISNFAYARIKDPTKLKTRITASKAKRYLLKDSTSLSKAIQEVLMQKTAKQTTKMKRV